MALSDSYFGEEIDILDDVDGDGVTDLVSSGRNPQGYCCPWIAILSGRTGATINVLFGGDYVDQ